MHSALRMIGILFLVGLAALLVPSMATTYYFLVGVAVAVLLLTFIVLGAVVSARSSPARRIGTDSDLSVALPKCRKLLPSAPWRPLACPIPPSAQWRSPFVVPAFSVRPTE